jgi:hypothetical protein
MINVPSKRNKCKNLEKNFSFVAILKGIDEKNRIWIRLSKNTDLRIRIGIRIRTKNFTDPEHYYDMLCFYLLSGGEFELGLHHRPTSIDIQVKEFYFSLLYSSLVPHFISFISS